MGRRIILDTNVLLSYFDIFDKLPDDEFIIHSIVAEELDNQIHNERGNDELAYKARKARNAIKAAKNVVYSTISPAFSFPIGWTATKNDNIILGVCKDLHVPLMTNDLAMQIKADSIDVKWEEYGDSCDNNSYTGFTTIYMDQAELADWYQSEVKINKWDLNINEYLMIQSDVTDKQGVAKVEVVDTWTWTPKGFRHFSTKKLDSVILGKIKTLDEYQICAIDSFSNNPITMIKGKAGTGKSLLTVAYAMSMIESKSKIEKLIVFTNPLPTKNSAKLGYYPGTKDQKLLDSQIGNMLASKFGKVEGVERLIQDGRLQLLPFSDIRGFDTTDMKAIIWITEAQNLDIELMRLAIQRVGNDCQLIIDGDYEAQVDCSSFQGKNNGMIRVSEVFRGQDFYGEIELQNVYRSKWADWANKL